MAIIHPFFPLCSIQAIANRWGVRLMQKMIKHPFLSVYRRQGKNPRELFCHFLVVAMTIVFVVTNVQAATPSLLKRGGAHPLWFGFYFGPVIGVSSAEFERTILGTVGKVDYQAPNQMKLIETFGYHFSDSAEGLAIALDIQQSFGDSQFILQIVPRVLWDIPIVENLGLYLVPSFGFGYIFLSQDQDTMAGGQANGFTFQLAFDGKLILSDLFYVFLRPVAFEIQPVSLVVGTLQDWGTFLRVETLFGGGIIF